MVNKAMVFGLAILITLAPLSNGARAAFDCLTLTPNSHEEEKDYCRQELKLIEAELDRLLKLQADQQKHTGTLAGDVTYLTSQINALKTKIKARGLAISQLKVAIVEKNKHIGSLEEKIKREHESIAQLLRNTNEFDNSTFVHLVLSDASVSNFYSDVESYASIKAAVKASVDEIRGIKTETEAERKDLEDKQSAEANAKAELESSQKKVAQAEAQKRELLAISKQTEEGYKKLASQKKAQADKIRAALFPLRDSAAIPFGTALIYAENAGKKTGVRPAFVLAILKQESNLGANVGSCVIVDLTTGATKGVNSGTIFPNGIHPTRDLPLLAGIVEGVGRNPTTTRVSCPLAGGGYGGAMGPAQFIPSTWNLIKTRIANALGKATADPWNPEDAIMASSILLMDSGAGSRTYTAEREAACKYYSGRGCSVPGVKNAFYGNAVMSLATTIQADIDLLE